MAKISYILVNAPNTFTSFEEFASALRCIKQLGYQAVELNLANPLGFDEGELLRLVESIDLPVAAFLTGANYFSDGLCMSSPDTDVRQRAVKRLKQYTEIASRFGAVLVIGQMQGFLSDEPDQTVGEQRIEAGLKQVVEAADQHQTLIVLEPVNHLQAGFHNSLSSVMPLVERLGSPYFKSMLDTFHMNIEETSMTEPIHRLAPNIGHFHLCESNGSFLGSGHFDFPTILATLDAVDYAGYISVKVYREPWELAAERTIQYLADQGYVNT